MKKKIVPFFVGFVIIAGIILILYPTISLRINEKHKSRVTASYTETVEKLDETGCREYREAARAYNRGLEEEHALSKATLREERDQYKTYNSLLDPCKNGVMGMVRIPKIEVYLPIYHGMGDNILQAGIGHYPGSSLPVGEKERIVFCPGTRVTRRSSFLQILIN